MQNEWISKLLGNSIPFGVPHQPIQGSPYRIDAVGAKMEPTRSQKGPRIDADGAKMGQDGAKTGPRWGQKGPRWDQDGAKIGPDRPKMAPKWAKMALGWPKSYAEALGFHSTVVF